MRRCLPVVLCATALLGGCADTAAEQRQPASAVDGFRATGRLDGARVAVSRGNPIVVDGDCDPNEGLDDDLCVLSRTIDGVQLNLVVENPAVLVEGADLQVDERDCSADGCDGVTDVVVVDLRVDGDQRPVETGRIEVLEAGERVAVQFDLSLEGADGLTGEFDVALPRAVPVLGPDATESPDP